MKKFLSLLLSISLVFSMCSNVVFADDLGEDTYIVPSEVTVFDIIGRQDITIASGTASNNKYTKYNDTVNKAFHIYKSTNGSNPAVVTNSSILSDGSMIQIKYNGSGQPYVNMCNGVSLVKSSGRKVFCEGMVYVTESAVPSWQFHNNGNKASDDSNPLMENTWYKFNTTIDLTEGVNKLTFTYTQQLTPDQIEAGVQPHQLSANASCDKSSFTYLRVRTGGSGCVTYYNDVKFSYTDPSYKKAKITSIGTEKVVEGGQNVIPVELSEKIPNLTKDHITVVNKETNEPAAIDSIVTSDGDTHILNINLVSNIASWSEYELTIDAIVFGDGAKQRVGEGELEDVTSITDEFTTTKPPFAAKPFAFTSVGDNLNAKALVVNTTGEPKDMSFVFSAFNNEGKLISIVPTEHTGFVNSSGEYLEANISTVNSDKFNFFVIDNWTDRNQLFGANYNVDALGEAIAPEAQSSCEELSGSTASIELGELDYESKKIVVNLDTKQGSLTDGILFIYKNGESLSQSNLPIYAQAISTTADGRLAKEIALPSSLAYGEYIVEFSSASLGDKVTNTFNYLTPEEILASKKAAILADAKVQSDAQSLSEVLMGVNSAGEKLNDNFEIFGKDADLAAYSKALNKLNVFARMLPNLSSLASYDALVTLFEASASAQRNDEVAAQKLQIVTDAKASVNAAGLMKVILGIDDNENVINTNFELISSNASLTVYDSLKNKAAVFTHMYAALSYISNYSDLITYFEAAANTQKNKENTPSKPSSNNSSYGGTSVPMKETTPSGAENQQGTSASSSVFTDMTNHWASSYAEALYKRGIMKGYEDGSFRGENSITRAELAKTLVETFEIAAADGKTFGDVASSSWYAQYVATAAMAGIVNGFEDGSFGPDKEVTRQDAVLMLYRAMSIGRKLPIGYTFFADDLDISEYASGAIRTLGDLGIVGGNAKKQFLPTNSITRAEVATIICRAIDYIESH